MDPVIVGKPLLLLDLGGSPNVPHKVLRYKDLSSGEYSAKKSGGNFKMEVPVPKKTQLAVP